MGRLEQAMGVMKHAVEERLSRMEAMLMQALPQKPSGPAVPSAVTFRDEASETSNSTDQDVFAPDGSVVSLEQTLAYLCDLGDDTYGEPFRFELRRIHRIASSLDQILTLTHDQEEVRQHVAQVATELTHQVSVYEMRAEDPEAASRYAKLLEARVAANPMRRALTPLQTLARKQARVPKAVPVPQLPQGPAVSAQGAMAGQTPQRNRVRYTPGQPPPTPCPTCGQMHWSRDCPYRQQQQSRFGGRQQFAPQLPFGYMPPVPYYQPPPQQGGGAPSSQ